jgi:hypothetical protein
MTSDLSGVLEQVLTRRYGAPIVQANTECKNLVWNATEEGRKCVLCKPLEWTTSLRSNCGSLEAIYGKAIGGHLLGDALRVALLSNHGTFSLYSIEELNGQPEVQRANQLSPQTRFFMDAANVWFYGIENDKLIVYDAETDEIDNLGPVDAALDQLLDEWETAK